MTETFNPKFLPHFDPVFGNKEYFIIYGGRAGGKTLNTVYYFIFKLLGDVYFRGVVSRFTANSTKKSIYAELEDKIREFGLGSILRIKGDEILNLVNGNKIITHSLKIGDGAQTAQSKGIANATHLIIDEAEEIKNELDYVRLVDSFRTPNAERKIFILFNPQTKSHWIHKRWFIDGKPNPIWNSTHEFIQMNYRENIFLRQQTRKEYDDREFQNNREWRYELMGEWHDYVEGRVYDGWHFDYDPPEEASVVYGLDFGFSNDPCALVKVHKKNNKIWIKELVYQTGLTNSDLCERMTALGIGKHDLIVADSAEPKSIEDIRRAGFNIKPALKGPDSIRAGINKIKDLEVHVDPTSENLIFEYQNYAWQKGTNKPIDKANHISDALRYSLSLEAKPFRNKFK